MTYRNLSQARRGHGSHIVYGEAVSVNPYPLQYDESVDGPYPKIQTLVLFVPVCACRNKDAQFQVARPSESKHGESEERK
jgi:hypothetical protein